MKFLFGADLYFTHKSQSLAKFIASLIKDTMCGYSLFMQFESLHR